MSAIRRILVFLSLAVSTFCTSARADTALETETADLGKKGESDFSQSVQWEKSPDGKTLFTWTNTNMP